MLVCAFLVHIAHETAGAARTRSSLRPLLLRRDSFFQTSGASRREIANVRSIVIVREGGRSSIPETLMIESRSRGVLDRPVKPGDDSLFRLEDHAAGSATLSSLESRWISALLMAACRVGALIWAPSKSVT